MSLKRYDAAQVTMVFMGILIDSGYADGEFLTIESDANDYDLVIGTDGQGGRSRSNNLSATIKLKLMQTSDGNTFLGALRTAGLLAANGADIGPLLIRDRVSGTCMCTAANCWIAKPPDVSLDNKITMREWTFQTEDLVRVDTGS